MHDFLSTSLVECCSELHDFLSTSLVECCSELHDFLSTSLVECCSELHDFLSTSLVECCSELHDFPFYLWFSKYAIMCMPIDVQVCLCGILESTFVIQTIFVY